MKEIKFRVLDPIDHSIIPTDQIMGIYLDSKGTPETIEAWEVKNDQWGNPQQVSYILNKDDFQLLQYVGVYDDDGKEIYEHDIIKETKHDRLMRYFVVDDIRTFTREYDKGEHDAKWQVIGNIDEHPELLELLNEPKSHADMTCL